ncbi:putative membrane protein [Labilithrix luteola]|uniref:Putative membrane protein n=1 Tax=Labilithrix luteola TaxID=1391654 RepID=A0A0K1QFN5_9BACT|nr:DUF308 domain-containing protein [Labilithrix luteola]AKV04579.1 putative membrane protein [Labilithrix luteola]
MSTLDDDRRASWSLLLAGVVGLLCGFLALAWSRTAVAPRELLFGVYALFDGVASASFALAVRRRDNGASVYLGRAAVGLAAGLATILFPNFVLHAFRIVVGVWAISVGVAEVVLAARLRRDGGRATLPVAAGILALLCGGALLVAPGISTYSVGGTFAFLALLNGAASVSVATQWQEHRAVHA